MKAYWNLTPQEQVTRSMRCAAVSLLLAILFGVLGIINIYQEKNMTERCTATTTGYVVSVFPASRHRLQSYLTANYEMNGVQYHTEGRYSSGYDVHDTLSRKPVTVHYDPSDPKTSYAADAPETPLRTIWFLMALTFGIGCPAFIIQAKRLRKRIS